MNTATLLRIIGKFTAHAVLAAACIGNAAIAAERPVYKCSSGSHWKNGTCVKDPAPPPHPREKQQIAAPKSSSPTPGGSHEQAKLQTIPPSSVRPSNPAGDGRNALNTQPIPPGHPSKPSPKLAPVKSP